MKNTLKKKTEVKLIFDTQKLILDAIKSEASNEFDRRRGCEYDQVRELDRAICQIQKQLKSLEIKLNRLDSQVNSNG